MSYSTVNNVRSIVDTDITDAEIAAIITWVDEVIKIKINVALYTPLFLTNISSLYSAYRCMLKDSNARSLGEFSENRSVALQLMKDEIDGILGNPIAGIPAIGAGVKLVASMEPL